MMLIDGIKGILDSGKLSGFRGYPSGHKGGYWVQKLEESFKEYFKVKYAVAMNSATACLHSAAFALVEDRAFVTPYSFVTSASCVDMCQAEPVFIDIDEDTWCMNPKNLKDTTDEDVAIPVHLMGHPADLDRFPAEMTIIEDAAQAIGAKYKGKLVGTIGKCGIFSFNQSKHINTGEGGMLITNDNVIARVAMAMRNHGEVSDPELKIVGYNYRLCEIEAYMAYEQFKTIDENLAYRNELALYMTEQLSEIEGFTPPVVKDYCTRHSWYTYGIKYHNKKLTREDFQQEMKDRGFYFGSGYVKPLTLLPIYDYGMGYCPVAERMWKSEIMVTDILKWPLTKKDIDKCIETIKIVLK